MKQISLNELPNNLNLYLYGKGYKANVYTEVIPYFRKDITIMYIDDFSKSENTISFESFYQNIIQKKINNFLIEITIITEEIKQSVYSKLKKYSLFENLIEIKSIDLFVSKFPFSHMIKEEELSKYQESIQSILSILDSDHDKKLYANLLEYRTLNKMKKNLLLNGYVFEQFSNSNEEKQYLDYLNPAYINTIIEGGVYDGESTYKLYRHYINDSEGYIYGFEPFMNKFLDHNKLLKLTKNIKILEFALWDKKTILNFQENSSASKINITGGIQVQSTTIDDFREENNLTVDLIKLDVEGAEQKVILGALKTIKQDRPQLAISIYHTIDDFIQMVLNIVRITDNYTFKIGHYSNYTHETILYGIPKEKRLTEV